MASSLVYHICTRFSWNNQADSKVYIHDSLAIENFIHCSEEHQIKVVLDRYFQGQNNLLRLTIDTAKLVSRLQYDEAQNGDKFPHIYGSINKEAITKINKI